jgi:hypothetical protein
MMLLLVEALREKVHIPIQAASGYQQEKWMFPME